MAAGNTIQEKIDLFHPGNKKSWVLCLVFTAFFPTSKVLGADIVVVRSHASAKATKLYDEAIDGIRQGLPKSFEIIAMEGDLVDAHKLAQKVIDSNPKVVIAIGVKAAVALNDHVKAIPVIYCMISHSIQSKLKSSNTTGVTMQPTPGDQLKAFKKVVPSLHRIGLVYYPKLSGMFVKAAKTAAKAQGLEIIAAKIDDRRQVPAALKSVLAKSDGFWILRDGKVVNHEFLSQVLLIQAQRKIPVMAFSEKFVKKGILCSFSSGYREQGRQAAKLANAILSGKSIDELPTQAPDGTLTINITAASKIGISIPPGLKNQPKVRVLQK